MATVAELETRINELVSRVDELESRQDGFEDRVTTITESSGQTSDIPEWMIEELDGLRDEDGNTVQGGLFDHIYGMNVRPVRDLTNQQSAAAADEQARLEAELARANKRANGGR